MRLYKDYLELTLSTFKIDLFRYEIILIVVVINNRIYLV